MKNTDLERFLSASFGIEAEAGWTTPPQLDPKVQEEIEDMKERKETYDELMRLIGIVELQTPEERRKSAAMIKKKVNDLLRRPTK